MYKKFAYLIALVALPSCAHTSRPREIGKDSFTISGSGHYSSDDDLDDATDAATLHCNSLNKKMLLQSMEKNGQAGTVVSAARVYYMCVDEDDPRYQERYMTKTPEVVIQRR